MGTIIKRAVVAIYIDPDFYPPTLNAVLNLAERCEEVILISRHNTPSDYAYPSNVVIKKIGPYSTVRDMEKQPLFLKVKYFLQFAFCLLKYSRSKKNNLVLLYDHFALYAYYLVKGFIGKKKIWYHNHDMPGKEMIRKYSIGGLAAINEFNAMTTIDFFSLPSKERQQYYPELKSSIPVFIIPNYPSLKVYTSALKSVGRKPVIKIIFQGFLGAGHSLEEIVHLLKESINGQSMQLILKGSVTDTYKTSLTNLADELGVGDKLIWVGIGPYSAIPVLTASCDIGIGINMNTDIVSQNQGTASNKIYEYAASGLPVILYDTKQFRTYLDKYPWAFFTDGSIESLRQQIASITNDLPALSASARLSFEQGLNFETAFTPVMEQVLATVK